MTYSLILMVPEAYRVDANRMMLALGFDDGHAASGGNGQSFTIGLSATGAEPYSHFLGHIYSTEDRDGAFQTLDRLKGGALPPIDWTDYSLTEADVIAVLDHLTMSARSDLDPVPHLRLFFDAASLTNGRTYYAPGDPPPVSPVIVQPPALPCYFDLADSTGADVSIGEPGSTPPASDAVQTKALYPRSPLTDGFSFVASRLEAADTWFGRKWAMQWCFDVGRNNPINPAITVIPSSDDSPRIDGRLEYTIDELAIAASLASAIYKIGGAEADWKAPITDRGFNPDLVVITYADAVANKESVFTTPSSDGRFLLATDKIILPDSQWDGVDGLAFDEESERAVSVKKAYLVELAGIVQGLGKLFLCYTNPVTGTRWGSFEEDPTFPAAAMASFDYFLVSLVRGSGGWTGSIPDQYAASKAAFGADWDAAKIALMVGFGVDENRLTVAEAAQLRTTAIEGDGIGFVLHWMLGATFGGDITNESVQKMLALMGEDYTP